MESIEHENYARDLLSSLSDNNPESQLLAFEPNPKQSRNAARAVRDILCHRIFESSKHHPARKNNTTYEWKEGRFNSRNITDRASQFTNLRRKVANSMHAAAGIKPASYLLAFASPGETNVNVWALPEPIMYDCLSSLTPKEDGDEYPIEISTDTHTINHYAQCPDLRPYFRILPLSGHELNALDEARKTDDAVKVRRRAEKGAKCTESETTKVLATAEKHLSEDGAFEPSGIVDARDRMLSSIVRRRGQPAFRKSLLAAYNKRCAISGCDVEAVLEAAHILPYKGPKTNHLGNGLLLRTDLHTLFDLKLIAVDVATMRLLTSPSLANTSYEKFHGIRITLPAESESQPSLKALEEYRLKSNLDSMW